MEDRSKFGPWVERVEEFAASFHSAHPYPHVEIPNFFSHAFASELATQFPSPHASKSGWFLYNNPIEIKFANNDRTSIPPCFNAAIDLLNSDLTRRFVSAISGVPFLEEDPHLHGGGIHCHPPGGKLDMHLDYSIHPLSGKERRLNLIVYLTPDWDRAWGGGLQLWEADMARLGRVVPCMFNTAVLFRTTDQSWHGLPDAISSPPGVNRNSLAVYYVTDPRPSASQRLKAQAIQRASARV